MLAEECPSCEDEDLKLVYDAMGEKELDLLAAEAKFQICIDKAQSSNGIKSIFPCILNQVLNILPIVPLASKVIRCSLDNTPCYGDLSNKPGQLNLLIQSERFKSFLTLALLVFGGDLFGNPVSILSNTTRHSYRIAKGTDLVQHLSMVLATLVMKDLHYLKLKLEELLNVGLEIPSDEDIRNFASTWNRSLPLWEFGRY